MESTEEQSGLLHQILPPRLEDAGLEDPALPPELIHEAFLKAAAAVKSSAASIFFGKEDDEDCLNDPWPTTEGTSDAVVGIEPENDLAGPCTIEKGNKAVTDEVRVSGDDDELKEVVDELVVGEEVKLGEDGEACVDGFQGLDIKEKKDMKKIKEEEEEKEKKPILVEGCFEGGFTCWGFCAIDPAGTVIYSASKKEFITVEPLIPEALGVRWGLQMATSLGLSDFSVISDALLVISCLKNIFVVATCLLSKTGGIS